MKTQTVILGMLSWRRLCGGADLASNLAALVLKNYPNEMLSLQSKHTSPGHFLSPDLMEKEGETRDHPHRHLQESNKSAPSH